MKAGIISDTHLSSTNALFQKQVDTCFQDCDLIIHAGDLTDLSILNAFNGKTIQAVHGNMCNHTSYKKLPSKLLFDLGGFSIGLIHGDALGRWEIENRLWDVFPEADCMIYGHTHKPVCHKISNTLVINPGSFCGTGKYGAPGTYAILEVGETLSGSLHEVPHFS